MAARAALVAAAFVVLLGVGAGPARAADPATQLAQRYAPVVRLSLQEEPCAAGEAFEPIDVRALFGDDEVALRGPWRDAAVVKVAPQLSDVARGRYGYSLDFPGDALTSSACSYEQWQRRITDGRRPTVYAHIVEEDGELALQYWFFYVYNDFNNRHEGDWESIQLNFHSPSVAAALDMRPFEIGYSQHRSAERADWGDAKLELVGETHPVVYPAEGSHANYFSGALFIGSSSAQGVGCDNTNEPWREIKPVVDVIPQGESAALAAYPWLGYHGRWGERRNGFYDAPTGPTMRLQWTNPIAWASQAWRSRSFALAGGRSLGPTATTFFCGAVGAVSTAMIVVVAQPTTSVLVVLAILVVLAWLGTRTRWQLTGPTRLRQRRAWGSLLTSAGETYARDKWLFLGIGAFFLALGVVIAALQFVVFHLTGLAALVETVGRTNAATDVLVLGFGFAFNMVGLAVVQAACAAALDAGARATVAGAYRSTYRRLQPLIGGLVLAALAVAVLDLTLIGLPIAIWLVVRWSMLAQVVTLEDTQTPVGSLRSSARVVRGHWWRTASVNAFVTGGALLLGPVVGTLLLFTTDASFDVVNIASDLVYTIALPFAALATTYLYFDLVSSSHDRGA